SVPLIETTCNDGLDEDFDLVVDCLDPDCSAAANCAPLCPDDTIDAPPSSYAGSTVGAPNETSGSCDFAAYYGSVYSPDVALEFTAPADGTYAFATDNATDFDTVLYVLDGCGGPELACDDVGGFGGETVS